MSWGSCLHSDVYKALALHPERCCAHLQRLLLLHSLLVRDQVPPAGGRQPRVCSRRGQALAPDAAGASSALLEAFQSLIEGCSAACEEADGCHLQSCVQQGMTDQAAGSMQLQVEQHHVRGRSGAHNRRCSLHTARTGCCCTWPARRLLGLCRWCLV